jgi:glycosyltransferase involved in cell wall biosynthesis
MSPRVGMIAYSTSQGLGHLAKSFYDSGLIQQVLIYKHPHGEQRSPTHREWYPEGTPVITKPFVGEVFERFLDDLDIVLFFETPFDWNFPERCHQRGVKTVLTVMYEWCLQNPPHQFDLFLNPSLLDQQYFPQGIYVPIPVENATVHTPRTLCKRFLHNAGHIGSRNHKGTLELMRAMEFVTSPIELTIRCQDGPGMKRLLEAAPNCKTDERVVITDHEIPREKLFHSDFDVYIAPEKYNGISLPLQEAFASGMPVMTTNRFPMNQWLPEEMLIPVSGTIRVQVARGHLEIEESIVSPQEIARTIDNWYGKDISHLSEEGKRFKEENSWEALKPKFINAFESIL